MSLRTPILMVLLEICACAAPAENALAIASASNVHFVNFIERLLKKTATATRLYDSHAEVLVKLRHFRIKLRIADHVDDTPMFHHVMSIRNGCGKVEVLLDQQYGEALGLQLAYCASDLLDDHRCEPFGRLV